MMTEEKKAVFDRLVRRVRRLDNDAADYLQMRYDTGTLTNTPIQYINLDHLLSWAGTPQGHSYWMNIHHKVRHMKDISPKGNEY